MSPTLYFLRSSESKIVQNMTSLAHKPAQNLNIYYDFYGLTANDLGLYALVDNAIVGAIWSRKINQGTPQLSVAVVPKFRSQGIGKAMMEQFLLEAGACYATLEVQTYSDPNAIKFYHKYGFVMETEGVMKKSLETKEVIRPTDGYDPRKWMD